MRDEYKHETTANILQAKTLCDVKTLQVCCLASGAGFSYENTLYIYCGMIDGIHSALRQDGKIIRFSAMTQVIPVKVQFTSL